MCVSRSVSPTGFLHQFVTDVACPYVLCLISLCKIQRHNLFYSILPIVKPPKIQFASDTSLFILERRKLISPTTSSLID